VPDRARTGFFSRIEGFLDQRRNSAPAAPEPVSTLRICIDRDMRQQTSMGQSCDQGYGKPVFEDNNRRRLMTRKMALATILACVMAAAAVATTSGGASAYTGEELASQTKLSLAEARAIALKVYAGEITSEELEKEKGGSGLRYSFDIKNGSVTHEVGVDAKTGRVLENSVERSPSR
jgi:uncharacterized membrane protein YkoI